MEMGISVRRISMWQWLTERAKFPRFVWVVLALGICTVAGALGYRILTASTVMVNATDKFQIAVDAQKEALQHRAEACEVLQAMTIHFSEAQVAMNKRFDELQGRLEKMKERAKRGDEAKPVETIEVAQMALRSDKEMFNRWDLERNLKDPKRLRDILEGMRKSKSGSFIPAGGLKSKSD
jgi:predicted adenine nucleotide alpha hydrolase (AANH) superfamily ATPase